jgi:peroxiredoxin
MKNIIYLNLTILLILSNFFLSCSKSNEDSQVESEPVRSQPISETKNSTNYPKAPNFKLIDQDGNTITLKDYKGKVVILDFWATWCGPCQLEIPGYVDLYKEYKDQGLTIIGVSLDRDGWTPVRPFIEQYKITYPIVIGNMDIVSAYGGINSIPTTFVINKTGEVVHRKIGYKPKEYFKEILAELL